MNAELAGRVDNMDEIRDDRIVAFVAGCRKRGSVPTGEGVVLLFGSFIPPARARRFASATTRARSRQRGDIASGRAPLSSAFRVTASIALLFANPRRFAASEGQGRPRGR